MKHPTPDQWMDFLYGEAPRAHKLQLKQHLRDCSECRFQVEQWRQTQGALNKWKLFPASRLRSPAALLKWAAAAVILIGCGYLLGAAAAPVRNTQGIQARLELQEKLTQQLARRLDAVRTDILETSMQQERSALAEFARAYAQNRTQDQQTLMAELARLEAEHAASLQALRKELETVAIATQDNFDQANNRLIQLANMK